MYFQKCIWNFICECIYSSVSIQSILTGAPVPLMGVRKYKDLSYNKLLLNFIHGLNFADFNWFPRKFAFFSTWVFSHEHSRFTGQQGIGEAISLTPLYHFHPLHRHLDVSWAITAENSPLHIASSRTRTGNLCFPSASR